MKATKRTPRKPQLKLNWEYCECGCHQYEVTVGGRHFTVYWDLKTKWYFAEGHMARYSNTIFRSFKAADTAAIKVLKRDQQALAKALG